MRLLEKFEATVPWVPAFAGNTWVICASEPPSRFFSHAPDESSAPVRSLPVPGMVFVAIYDHKIALLASHNPSHRGSVDRRRSAEEISMAEGASPKPPGRVRGRPFEKGKSGN